jgi:hypothetical protein
MPRDGDPDGGATWAALSEERAVRDERRYRNALQGVLVGVSPAVLAALANTTASCTAAAFGSLLKYAYTSSPSDHVSAIRSAHVFRDRCP